MNVIKIKTGFSFNEMPTLELGELAICTENNGLYYGGSEGNAIQLNQNVCFKNVSDDYLVSVQDRFIFCDTTNGDINITLPDNSLCEGKQFTIKKVDPSQFSVIVKPDILSLIDGDSQFTITDTNESITLICSGMNWYVI